MGASTRPAVGLEETFGGGGYSARQRAALLQLVWDHVSSSLDGRESAFELHASGGMPGWRAWLRRSFNDYNSLANTVLKATDLPMPAIDVASIGTAPVAQRRSLVNEVAYLPAHTGAPSVTRPAGLHRCSRSTA